MAGEVGAVLRLLAMTSSSLALRGEEKISDALRDDQRRESEPKLLAQGDDLRLTGFPQKLGSLPLSYKSIHVVSVLSVLGEVLVAVGKAG